MVSDGDNGCITELDPSGCLPGILGTDGLVANNSLERATLTRHTARKLQAHYSAASGVTDKPGRGGDGGGVFWTLVTVLLVLALSNMALTFFAMGVLRLGIGMESIEFITSPQSMLKLSGVADLGVVQQQDGVIATYADEPLNIVALNSKVSIGINTVRPSPALHVGPRSVHLVSVNKMQVVEPVSGRPVFSTARPSFGVPRGVSNLHVQRAQTHRVASPTGQDLGVRADSTIRVKGNEGVSMEGRTLEWNADQDIFLRSMNGSLVLDGGAGGIFVEVNNLPLAGPLDQSRGRGQYKLCVCHRPEPTQLARDGGRGGRAGRGRSGSGGRSRNAGFAGNKSTVKKTKDGDDVSAPTLSQGHLFRVPVPLDNMRRSREHQINCASFTNPCMMM